MKPGSFRLTAPLLGIFSRDPVRRGRFMRRHDSGAGCGARGRGSQATHPGGAGAPPGTTTSPREELADGGPQSLPEARSERPTRKAPRSSEPEAGQSGFPKARPGAAVKTPPRRAERRRASATMHAHKEWTRRLARLSLGLPRDGRREGLPGADQRIRAMMLGCLTTESVRGARRSDAHIPPPPRGG